MEKIPSQFHVNAILCELQFFDKFLGVNRNVYIGRASHTLLKLIYSEKATKFGEIFPLLLTTVNTVKSKEKISQNFVAFSEYMNFTNVFAMSILFSDFFFIYKESQLEE